MFEKLSFSLRIFHRGFSGKKLQIRGNIIRNFTIVLRKSFIESDEQLKHMNDWNQFRCLISEPSNSKSNGVLFDTLRRLLSM